MNRNRHLIVLALLGAACCLLPPAMARADLITSFSVPMLRMAQGYRIRPLPPPTPAAPAKPAAASTRSQLPEGVAPDHPLVDVIQKLQAGEFGKQEAWRLPLLLRGLHEEPRTARLTAFSSRCADGGGSGTRWGTRVREGICAADPRYWGPGSVIYLDEPVNMMLIVEDTGGAVRGRDRFDVCFGDDAEACSDFGVQSGVYVPLYMVPPTRSWGTKPEGWHPPILPLDKRLVLALCPAAPR
jgi:3D (Asp-Asp-Asp) domain-containing protein